MTEDLSELINKRRKEAYSLNLAEKASCIASNLGGKKVSRDVWNIMTEWIFKREDFEVIKVNVDNGGEFGTGPTVFVRYKRNLVFQGTADSYYKSVESYVPGSWLEGFSHIYEEAKVILDERKRKHEEEHRNYMLARDEELKKRFGL